LLPYKTHEATLWLHLLIARFFNVMIVKNIVGGAKYKFKKVRFVVKLIFFTWKETGVL
jgi:hypothetical protein